MSSDALAHHGASGAAATGHPTRRVDTAAAADFVMQWGYQTCMEAPKLLALPPRPAQRPYIVWWQCNGDQPALRMRPDFIFCAFDLLGCGVVTRVACGRQTARWKAASCNMFRQDSTDGRSPQLSVQSWLGQMLVAASADFGAA